MKFVAIALFLSLSALLTSCSKDGGDDKTEKKITESTALDSLKKLEADHTLTVTDTAGSPLAQVQILVGTGLNAPFVGNWVETDQNGRVLLPADWNSSLPVSLRLKGYLSAVYLEQLPQGQTYRMRQQESISSNELSGVTTGFQVKNRDGLVDFGLTIPALDRQKLFNFQVGMILSSKNDSMSVLGQSFSLPSNISLPNQKESYILPITLDKQNYRMDFSQLGPQKVFTARGQFPLKKIVDALRANQSILDVINDFQIQGGSLKDINIRPGANSANLPVNELSFTQSSQFQVPLVDGDQMIFALALSEYQNTLFPTDFKNAKSNSVTTLRTAAGSQGYLLAVLKNRSEFQGGPGIDRLSASLIPFEKNSAPQMLSLLRDPQIVGSTLKADVPALLPGLQVAGSFALLSRVEKLNQGGTIAIEKLTRLLEVYSPSWSESLELPQWPGESLPTGTKRWEISRVGAPLSKKLDLGPGLFETATHVTHASTDF